MTQYNQRVPPQSLSTDSIIFLCFFSKRIVKRCLGLKNVRTAFDADINLYETAMFTGTITSQVPIVR
jgi:hypothetical protein